MGVHKIALIPAAYILFAFMLSILLHLFGELFPVRSPLNSVVVIPFFSSIASGMLAFTGIVFSISTVMLQLGNSSYSPRFVEAVKNYIFPHAAGIFTGTFIFTLLSLLSIDIKGNTIGSSLTIWAAFAWLLASVVVFVLLVLRVGDTMIARVLLHIGRRGNPCDRTDCVRTLSTYREDLAKRHR